MRRGKGKPRQVSEESQAEGERMEEGRNEGGKKTEKLKDLRLRPVMGSREAGWPSLWKSEVKGTRDQAEKAQLGAAHAPPLLSHKGQWQCSSPSPLMFLPIALLPA